MSWDYREILADLESGEPVLFTRGGKIYRVVTLATDPTLTLEEVGGDGSHHHYVINSLLFAEFDRLVKRRSDE